MELADPQPFLQGGDTGDMEFADLDGDGDADLIITGSGNMSDGTTHGALTTLYFNDGEGNLTPITDHGIVNLRVSKIALADVDDGSNLHIQALCDVRMQGTLGERHGRGVLEQLIVGPHAPSGFTSMTDMAP